MNKIKILIVEDEPIVALDIKNTIMKLGYLVTDIKPNYTDALASIKRDEPDIIFMDIHLENSKDGIEIVKEIKKSKNIPIIYLTAFSDDKTMQKAIETNPVSYIMKPFKRVELKSSILLSIYKMKNIDKMPMDIQYTPIGFDYYYDLKNDNLFYKMQPIQISLNEKKFLRLLITANGQIVPLSTIEEYIWQNSSISDSTFRTLVYRLRSKLEFKIIETIPSFGYRLSK
jgi:DNA-binding response OmpR family regulator